MAAAATIAVFAVMFAGGLTWSLTHKEWQRCPSCGGDPRRRGTVWTSAHSHCHRCRGTKGEIVRLGVRVFRPARARELTRQAGRDPWWLG